MNLAVLAEESVGRLGNRVGLVFEDEEIRMGDAMTRTRRLHRAFAGLGLERGATVVLCIANHPVVYELLGAVFRTGATAVPVMSMVTVTELRFVLENTGAVGVITDTFSVDKVRSAAAGLRHVEWVAVQDGTDSPHARPREVSVAKMQGELEQTNIAPIDAAEDVALMLYTSGTTGRPKGVMLTHENLLAGARMAVDAAELHLWKGPRIGVSAMPMAHIFGVSVMTAGYYAPTELEGYLVQLRWFDPTRVMELVQQHRANVLPAVPTMLSMILNHPALHEYDLGSLQEVICGAAPLAPELARTFEARFGCRVREIYGMTENSGMATANPRSESLRAGSAGKPYPGTEIRIVDDADVPVKPRSLGEIVTRGPTTMKGYWRRPEATAEALRGGFLHTGDIGYLDEEGYLYVVDRKKDMIIKGGENIYPAELEAALHEHAGIAEAAVVGVPDAKYGELVVAFVVPSPSATLTAPEVTDFLRTRVSTFKLPESIHLCTSLPKLGVGKIVRRELRERAAELRRAANEERANLRAFDVG